MTFRSVLAAFAVGAIALLTAGGGAVAQSGAPTSVNPTASSVKEQQLLDALKPQPGTTSAIAGRVSIPDKGSGNLINPTGREFRDYHQSTVPRIGALSILGILALVVLFYLVRGKVRMSSGASGQTIVRFGGLDRFAHWLTAVSFLALALTGLNLTFGKSVLLPIIGPEAFTNVSQLGKLVHNYVSFAFALGIILMFVLWVKDNLPHPRDIVWFFKGGGLIGNWHPAAARFNAGQKIIFWFVILGGSALAVTGYILMFPFQFTDIAGQQLSQILHGLIGAVLFAVIIAHIYIGSIGMEGAFSAMGSGKVDLNWAKDHHSIWVERVAQRKPDAIKGRATPAE